MFKKSILALAIALASLQPAFAMDEIAQDETAVTQEEQNLEPSAEDQAAEVLEDAQMRGPIDDIIGGAIGGAIDAAIGRRHPRFPHRPHRGFVCFAQNRRGEIFRARGWSPRQAQQQAIQECYAFSRFCRPMGCR